MSGPLNGPGVRDAILKQGKESTEKMAYSWGNLTKSIQDLSKGAVTVDSGRRAGLGTFKASKCSRRCRLWWLMLCFCWVSKIPRHVRPKFFFAFMLIIKV